MLDQSRLAGDILFFTTGDTSGITNTSIIYRLEQDGREIQPMYAECYQLGPDSDGVYDFTKYASDRGWFRPCMDRLVLLNDSEALLVFSRVDTENFPYDVRWVQSIVGDRQLWFCGTIKDFVPSGGERGV